jgi:hypothetical protein
MLLTLLSPSGAASGVTIDCNVGTASAVGLQAAITQSVTVSTNLGTAAASGLSASVSQATTVQTRLGTASASGLSATVSQEVTVKGNLGQASSYGNQASISTGGSVDVKVSWLQFNTQATPCDVKVSWVQFDTNSTPCDVKVSWLEFNSSNDVPSLASLGGHPIKQKKKILHVQDEEIQEPIPESYVSRIRNEFLSEALADDLINRARKRKSRAEEEALLLMI